MQSGTHDKTTGLKGEIHMPETLNSKIRRSDNTAGTYIRMGRYYLAMARKGAGDIYYGYAREAFKRAERCNESSARLKAEIKEQDG